MTDQEDTDRESMDSLEAPQAESVLVKICGLCRASDGSMAAAAGADFVGAILSPGFSRSVIPCVARSVYDAASAERSSVRRVGVVVNPDVAYVPRLAESLSLDVIQFHGQERPEELENCEKQGPWDVWKVLRLAPGESLSEVVRPFLGKVQGILVEAWHPTLVGGAGTMFEWDKVSGESRGAWQGCRFIAAGGLTPDNVCEAVRVLNPHVVDVSSGVEAELCTKDPDLVQAFVSKARRCGRLNPKEDCVG